MDISQLTIVELKALAYDETVKMQQVQQNLNFLNARISELQREQDKQPDKQDEVDGDQQ